MCFQSTQVPSSAPPGGEGAQSWVLGGRGRIVRLWGEGEGEYGFDTSESFSSEYLLVSHFIKTHFYL